MMILFYTLLFILFTFYYLNKIIKELNIYKQTKMSYFFILQLFYIDFKFYFRRNV